MPKLLQSAVVGFAFTALAAAVPASAGGYLEEPVDYGYIPGPELIGAPEGGTVVYSYSEVRIRSRGATPYGYGYGAAYLPGAPAYDTVVTRETRVISDPGFVYGAPKVHAYGPPAYYRGPAYGSIKDFGPPPVKVLEPVAVRIGKCGKVRYWDGGGCADARRYRRHRYDRGYIPRW
jgi:hypothetical protein